MLSLIIRFKHVEKALLFASFAIALLCICSNGSFGNTESSKDKRTEAPLKAAYLAHLLHYSTWDEEDLPSAGSTVGLAVVGQDGHHFAQVLLFLIDELKISSEPNDGLVSVESTKLNGMADWILLHHGHTFIMNCKDTFDHCRHFIEHGSFKKSESE